MKSITPSSTAPGRTIKIRLEGNDLDKVTQFTLPIPGNSITFKLEECDDKKEKNCATIAIPLDAHTGTYPLQVTTATITTPKNLSVDFAVMLPTSGDYVTCPTDPTAGVQTGINASGAIDGVFCSQSLLGKNESSDVFGKRVANTYLVVQVNIRNLSSDYEFLLHDIRVVYEDTAVGGRDKRLVRGVAEKGQAFDVRNLVVRSVEGTGSILGGLSVFKFATTDFKNAINVYQGPFATALRAIVPDFTVGQLNRLNDTAFTYQAAIVPKRSSASWVAFLPQQVFLSKEDKKKIKTAWWDPRQPAGRMLEFQRKLTVQVAGAHIAEVKATQPSLRAISPNPVTNLENVTLTAIGSNLDRVTSIRIGEKGDVNSIQKDLRLTQADPTLGLVDIGKLSLNPGKYAVTLVTSLGIEQPTSVSLEVKSGTSSSAITMPTVTSMDGSPMKIGDQDKEVQIHGDQLDQLKSIKVLKDDGTEDPNVTLTNLQAATKPLLKATFHVDKAADARKELSLRMTSVQGGTSDAKVPFEITK